MTIILGILAALNVYLSISSFWNGDYFWSAIYAILALLMGVELDNKLRR